MKAPSTSGSHLVTYTAARSDLLLAADTVDLTEEVSLIVQFQTPPVTRAQRFPQSLHRADGVTLAIQMEAEHMSFRTDLAHIMSQGPFPARLQRAQISGQEKALGREFRRLFNGAAIRVPRWAQGELQRLSYVKRISPDRPLKAADAAANHLIGADTVAARYALTGKGIRLGFLDTGLDYTLPAFGGGFGASYRVRGGYDFVHVDPNPLDDNGHGTEVASLAAAGNVEAARGVAPEATLYVYKVLDANGEGVSSTAIAALEQALADSVQILNLSFGGPGDPSDPLSQAVDNASAAGMLCVAAAGNTGPGYQTIGSPGCASGALTVGASDLLDHLTDFSSRGPTNMAFTLKPDLLAPGVGLVAMTLGGATASATGTSFSTPVASGAAALLKELHPAWSPEMLKSALMAGGHDLGADLWGQGKGRLDLVKTRARQTLILPQTLSLGMDDLTAVQWVRNDTLTLVNTSDASVSYQVQGPPSGSLPSGISMYLSQSALTLAPQSQEKFVLQTVVDPSLVKIPTAAPPAVTGLIRCTSATDTLCVPFALMLGSYIDLEVTTTRYLPIMAWFANTNGSLYRSTDVDGITYQNGEFTVRRLVQPGVYDVCVMLGFTSPGLTWLLRDSVVVNPAAKVVMDQGEALYTVGTIPLDEQGQPVDSALVFDYDMRMYSRRTGCSFGSTYWSQYNGNIDFTNRLPKITGNWILDYVASSDRDAPKVYSYAMELDHVEADHVVRPKAGDLQKRSVDYRFHAPLQNLASIDWFALEDRLFGFGAYQPNTATTLPPPFHQDWFSSGEPVTNFPHNQWYLNYRDLFSYSGTPPFYPYESPYLMTVPNQHPGVDGLLRSTLLESKGPALETRGRKVIYGLGPRFYYGRTENTSAAFKVKTNTWLGQCLQITYNSWPFIPCFLNQCLDFTPSALIVQLFDVQGTLLGQSFDAHYFTREVTPDGQYNDYSLALALPQAGRYTLQLTDTASWVLSHRGTASVLLSADTRLADKNPPSMTAFTVLADSEHADQILSGQVGEIQAVVSDVEGPLQAVELFYRAAVATAWRELPLTNQGGGRYSCQGLAALPEGYVSLRLLATDPSGNSLDYRAEPAFYHGVYQNHAPLPATHLRPGSPDTVQLYTTAQALHLHWQEPGDPDLDSLHYTLHLWGPAVDTTLSGLPDTALAFLVPMLAPAQRYAWSVETSDGQLTAHSDTARFYTAPTLLAVKEVAAGLPKAFALVQNYPNPFNPTTTIRYELPHAAHVSLKLYTVLGQEVKALVEGEQQAGRYDIVLNAQNLASGLYIYRLQAGSFIQSRTLCLVK